MGFLPVILIRGGHRGSKKMQLRPGLGIDQTFKDQGLKMCPEAAPAAGYYMYILWLPLNVHRYR